MSNPEIRNATASAATDSHVPRLVASLDTLDSEPETSLARVAEVETVEPGIAVWIEEASDDTSDALVALTKIVVTSPERLASDWAVPRGM